MLYDQAPELFDVGFDIVKVKLLILYTLDEILKFPIVANCKFNNNKADVVS